MFTSKVLVRAAMFFIGYILFGVGFVVHKYRYSVIGSGLVLFASHMVTVDMQELWRVARAKM